MFQNNFRALVYGDPEPSCIIFMYYQAAMEYTF